MKVHPLCKLSLVSVTLCLLYQTPVFSAEDEVEAPVDYGYDSKYARSYLQAASIIQKHQLHCENTRELQNAQRSLVKHSTKQQLLELMKNDDRPGFYFTSAKQIEFVDESEFKLYLKVYHLLDLDQMIKDRITPEEQKIVDRHFEATVRYSLNASFSEECRGLIHCLKSSDPAKWKQGRDFFKSLGNDGLYLACYMADVGVGQGDETIEARGFELMSLLGDETKEEVVMYLENRLRLLQWKNESMRDRYEELFRLNLERPIVARDLYQKYRQAVIQTLQPRNALIKRYQSQLTTIQHK
ncbi:MAG TPA: hypothetical protein DIT97_04785 [Gimesia maris]|uniref:Uncharacterized protein n=1 Tax=Gimesia maris TaxID=122 RepID=A0A3D3R328_9PLAN|nr:hypothetical protein [Gimesia maris]|tara:strand:+ start:40153 stop:41046 length:894 start_codon:yes stop_codon:yes gene_type:complete